LKVLSIPLSFDEFLHAHYLWLISIGRIPHTDFWCHYPALSYALISPFFRLLPESIYSIFALRYLGLCFFIALGVTSAYHARRLGTNWLWGVLPLALMLTPDIIPWVLEFRTDAYAALAAILAITIMFNEPAPFRSFLATGLSALSLIIMPKYVYPLTFALTAYFIFGFLKGKGKRLLLLLSGLAGLMSSVIFAQCIFLFIHTYLWSDIYWSTIIMQKYFLHCASTETSLPSLLSRLYYYFSTYWWIIIAVLAGLSGWLMTESKRRGVQFWVGLGVIIGLSLFWGTCAWPWTQYIVPGLFCLALFMPYIEHLLKRPFYQLAGIALLTILLSLMIISNGLHTIKEYASGSAAHDFSARQEFLHMVPRSERVVGFFMTHPCFREDQTFVTWDERWGSPKGFFPILPKTSKVYSYFQLDWLKHSLDISKLPASISLQAENYPPGWDEYYRAYLLRHIDNYVQADFLGNVLFIRKDLAK